MKAVLHHRRVLVSVPFDAGRGLMPMSKSMLQMAFFSFSTLRCGSWIDAMLIVIGQIAYRSVSVPFDAGRGLMQRSAGS